MKNGLVPVLMALVASGCAFAEEAVDTDGDTEARTRTRTPTPRHGHGGYRVRETGFNCDPDGELELTLDEGEHHLQINNPEPISGNPPFNRTALAALVVTNNPAYDPHAEYDPTPQD